MDQERPKQPEEKLESLGEEAKKLIAEGNLVHLIKNGQEFYFESYNLDKNLDKFFELRRNGWEVARNHPSAGLLSFSQSAHQRHGISAQRLGL